MAIDLTKAARVVPSEHGDVFTQSQWQSFDDKVAELKGAPGAPLKPKGLDGIEKVAGIRRVSYQHGVIYEHSDGKCVWVYGAINDRYNELGGPTSWLGLPLADEAQFDNEKGRVSLFERGSIYWWPDVGPVDLNDVIVHYTGLNCFGETSDGPFSSADEPYVILGAVAPAGSTATRSQIYTDVDKGDTRPDLIELYHGKPNGIVLSIVLMEHDDGDPDKYLDDMRKAVGAGMTALSAAIAAAFPPAIPILGLAAPFIPDAAEALGKAISDLLGTADDRVADQSISLSAKQMIVLAARTTNSVERQVGYKVVTAPLQGDGGNYQVYFGLITA